MSKTELVDALVVNGDVPWHVRVQIVLMEPEIEDDAEPLRRVVPKDESEHHAYFELQREMYAS